MSISKELEQGIVERECATEEIVQGHSQLHSESEVSLDRMRP